MIRKAALFFTGFFILAGASLFPGTGSSQETRLDVPYVPTRYPVVDEMLRMAAVNKDDVLYDLGCGDGRIVITAARRFGARGVGIDIDPRRIAECLENGVKEGVTDRVRFTQADLFRTDFGEATVMALYLLTSVNLKLRPKLLAELRPGSRIVSHNFMMDAWKPDESSEIEADGLSQKVFLWVVPANVSGTWTWTTPGPKSAWELTVEQNFQFAVGSLRMNGSEIPVKEIALRGDRVKVTAVWPDTNPAFEAVFEGRAFSHAISGKAVFTSAGKTSEAGWAAARNPATEKPLDVLPGRE